MSNQEQNTCPVCGSEAATSRQGNINYLFVECPTCGRLEIIRFPIGEDESRPVDYDKLAAYLYYNGVVAKPTDDYRFFHFVGTKDWFEKEYSQHPFCFRVTNDMVENWYPKRFSEKVDMFLLALASRAKFLSEPILFTEEQLVSACFTIRHPEGPMGTHPDAVNSQVSYFIGYLEEQKLVRSAGHSVVILPKGLERIDSLQKDRKKTTKNVFVAMSFAPEMAPVREAIRDALIKCGYTPRIIDEIEHNHQIVPEMLYEIREARFVVAELTGHNNGAYFEAGYALGQGKDVIQVCRKDKFGEDGHFDVKQVNTILWDTTEDLTNKLVARIKATIA